MKKLLIVLAVALAFLSFGATAQAGPLLDFFIPSQSSATPFISYAGGSAPLVGTGIGVQDVTGNGTTMNNGTTLTITGGNLTFTSGNFVNTANGNWNFASGGTFSVTGGIGSIGIANGSSLLFNGMFNGPMTVTQAGGNFKFLGTAVLTDVNATLASYFGMPTNTSFAGGLTILFTAPGNAGDPFSSTQISSGDLGVSPVPEPASWALLGVGSLSLLGFGWRRLRRAKA